MELNGIQSQLADVLHAISQGLLVPVIILLLCFIGYALFCIGSLVAEAYGERRNFKVETPKFLRALMEAEDADIPQVIKDSGLLNRQKTALLTVYDYRTLPGDALVALIRRLVSDEEAHYRKIVDRNNAAAKVSPMVGLMGTLIPLGPGVAALGQADTAALSSSLLIAFDTTVAGLIVAAICLVIGKVRSNWYDDYMAALDAGMATMLQKIELMREAGQIQEQEPTDYAELFALGLKAAKESAKEEKPQAAKTTQAAAPIVKPAAETIASEPAATAADAASETSASAEAETPSPAAAEAAAEATASVGDEETANAVKAQAAEPKPAEDAN